MKLPVPGWKGITFDVIPRPRSLTLLVGGPDHPARLSAAIKALTERVALRREDLPASVGGRPLAGEMMVWRCRLGTRAKVAAFAL
ncbi:hypothetical protein M3484_05145 [Pseudomonas sp. GX19020]|uniref:hypothetical protein n=1 Tax=Pseudomonas sp. GX19020 TaxID=2942277 RepID=UPI0020187DAD|nr:hypothetical protein [Pseudomonas sp. GX19020]MCL4065948.1 hypothetical protein [Pseudomonas sp. GX19020]